MSVAVKGSISGLFDKKLAVIPVVLILFAVDLVYQYAVRHLLQADAIRIACMDALVYTAILWIVTRLDLARVTLCFLALPYLLFIPGWLNPLTAIVLLGIFLYCLIRAVLATSSSKMHEVTVSNLVAFLAILALVNFSGAGGYGFQWPDYRMHNARLNDLILYEWPIRYGANQNFVYYFGYYLPSAVLGKFIGVNAGMQSMYAWTVLGVALAVRWLDYLSQWRFSFGLVIILALFGPWDIINVWYLAIKTQPLTDYSFITLPSNDQLGYATSNHLGLDFFLGGYMSNTYQLYWSPQQVIAGWLCISLLTDLFIKQQFRFFLFVYALLCLWGPLVMIAIAPMVFFTVIAQLAGKNQRAMLSLENTLGAGALSGVFVIFYLSGSAAANPSHWLLSAVNFSKHADMLLAFFLFSWGVYAIAITPFMVKMMPQLRTWFCYLVIALLLLPMRVFGEWSDLLCRGSAPLMFLLLVFFLRAIHFYRHHNSHHKKNKTAVLLLCLLLPGIGAAVSINRDAFPSYGKTAAIAHVDSYGYIAYPNLGPDGTLFEKWLRRRLPEK